MMAPTRMSGMSSKMVICSVLGGALAIAMAGVVSDANALDIDAVVSAAAKALATPEARAQQQEDMRQFVALESVAASAAYGIQTRKCAEWLSEWLRTRLGMEDATEYESGYRNPVVIGSVLSAAARKDKPSIVLYGHYDVQPVDGEWTISAPFELKKMFIEGYGDVLTGRGSQDCKGTLYSALSALAALHDSLDGGLASLPMNIIVCVEGEEEIGSPGFGHVLKENKALFEGADFVLSADGGQPHTDRGALTLSTRGLFGVQIDIKGANIDLHSGSYGGSILNPIVALSRVVASMHDPVTSKITLPGFYDDVEDLSEAERAELEVVDDVAEAAKLGITQMVGEQGYSTMERKTVRPTLELTGIYGGFRGEGIKTVLPSEAHAKIVFRLVAGQSPDRVFAMLEKHLADVAPTLAPGVSVSVQRLIPGARAYKADRESMGFSIASDVLSELYNASPQLSRTGGSVNAFADFYEILKLECVSFSFGASDSFQHAPDERMRLESISFGQQAYLRMMNTLVDAFGDDASEF